MRIPPFKELNAPDKLGYWTNKQTGEKYGGQYISPLLIPNLKKVEAGFKKAMKDKKFLAGLEEQLVKVAFQQLLYERKLKTNSFKKLLNEIKIKNQELVKSLSLIIN